jgi:hypothetical protein
MSVQSWGLKDRKDGPTPYQITNPDGLGYSTDDDQCQEDIPMTTSMMPDILTEVLKEEPIAFEKIAYLQTRAKLRLHDLILRMFATAEDTKRIDQATIARRLGQTRSRISQQLSVPGNWTIDSATKLAAAIGGEIDFRWVPFPEPIAVGPIAITEGSKNTEEDDAKSLNEMASPRPSSSQTNPASGMATSTNPRPRITTI